MVGGVVAGALPSEFTDELPLALREPLLDRSRLIHARRGQIIIAEGASATDVYFIASGLVQVSLFSLHGRETILRDMGPGRIFGELAAIDNQPRSASVIAIEDSQLSIIAADQKHFN